MFSVFSIAKSLVVFDVFMMVENSLELRVIIVHDLTTLLTVNQYSSWTAG